MLYVRSPLLVRHVNSPRVCAISRAPMPDSTWDEIRMLLEVRRYLPHLSRAGAEFRAAEERGDVDGMRRALFRQLRTLEQITALPQPRDCVARFGALIGNCLDELIVTGNELSDGRPENVLVDRAVRLRLRLIGKAPG